MHDDRWLTESLNRMTLTLLLSDSCAQDDVNKDSLPFLFTVFLGEKQASTFFEIGRFLTAAAAAGNSNNNNNFLPVQPTEDHAPGSG